MLNFFSGKFFEKGFLKKLKIFSGKFFKGMDGKPCPHIKPKVGRG